MLMHYVNVRRVLEPTTRSGIERAVGMIELASLRPPRRRFLGSLARRSFLAISQLNSNAGIDAQALDNEKLVSCASNVRELGGSWRR